MGGGEPVPWNMLALFIYFKSTDQSLPLESKYFFPHPAFKKRGGGEIFVLDPFLISYRDGVNAYVLIAFNLLFIAFFY